QRHRCTVAEAVAVELVEEVAPLGKSGRNEQSVVAAALRRRHADELAVPLVTQREAAGTRGFVVTARERATGREDVLGVRGECGAARRRTRAVGAPLA